MWSDVDSEMFFTDECRLIYNVKNCSNNLIFIGSMQWLFRKTRTMGTLTSKAEIDGVWVQAPGRLHGLGYDPRKKY